MCSPDFNVLSEQNLSNWRAEFFNNQKNILAQNVCTRTDPINACISLHERETGTNTVCEHKIQLKCNQISNRRNNVPSWITMGLKCVGHAFCKKYRVNDFEFSPSYLYFWYKIERCNYFLNSMVKLLEEGETIEGRLMMMVIHNPASDGGNWQMFTNLVNKYGLMPKKSFLDTSSLNGVKQMNRILRSKLHEYAKDICELYANQKDLKNIGLKIREMMEQIYKIIGICYSIPPVDFKWQYYNSTKDFITVGPITAKDFYMYYVKRTYNVNDKVCLVTDPRPELPYGRGYIVKYRGNMVGARQMIHNNQPVDVLLKMATNSLMAGYPVWLGCDIQKRFCSKGCREGFQLKDISLVFDVEAQTKLSKAERLVYHESRKNHVLLLTGVTPGPDGFAKKLRVQTFLQGTRGCKDQFLMTDEWFREFVFDIVVEKKFVATSVLKVFEKEPTELPNWDPMGNLLF